MCCCDIKELQNEKVTEIDEIFCSRCSFNQIIQFEAGYCVSNSS